VKDEVLQQFEYSLMSNSVIYSDCMLSEKQNQRQFGLEIKVVWKETSSAYKFFDVKWSLGKMK
jgi:hypothetical protein